MQLFNWGLIQTGSQPANLLCPLVPASVTLLLSQPSIYWPAPKSPGWSAPGVAFPACVWSRLNHPGSLLCLLFRSKVLSDSLTLHQLLFSPKGSEWMRPWEEAWPPLGLTGRQQSFCWWFQVEEGLALISPTSKESRCSIRQQEETYTAVLNSAWVGKTVLLCVSGGWDRRPLAHLLGRQ